MAKILEELVQSLEAHFQSSEPAVQAIHPAPGGSSERTSPFTLVILEGAPSGVGLCFNLLEAPGSAERYDRLDMAALARSGDALALARRVLGEDPAERIVGYGACHALSQLIISEGTQRSWTERDEDVVAFLSPGAGDHLGLVGYAPPFIKGLLRAGAERITVVERPDRARTVSPPEGVTVTTNAPDLTGCNKVLLTSTTLLNGTFDSLEELTRGAEVRALYGPGASILPHVILSRGIDAMAGLVVVDGASLVERQLGGRRWGDAKRKVLFVRNA